MDAVFSAHLQYLVMDYYVGGDLLTLLSRVRTSFQKIWQDSTLVKWCWPSIPSISFIIRAQVITLVCVLWKPPLSVKAFLSEPSARLCGGYTWRLSGPPFGCHDVGCLPATFRVAALWQLLSAEGHLVLWGLPPIGSVLCPPPPRAHFLVTHRTLGLS